jgi:hypothetical protein
MERGKKEINKKEGNTRNMEKEGNEKEPKGRTI